MSSAASKIALHPAGPPGFLIQAPSVKATTPFVPSAARALSTYTFRKASRTERHSNDSSTRFTELGPGSPASLDRGGMARSFHVAIAIASMYRSTEAIADPLDSALFRSDVK